jgi:pimeloyl-ACP methyl ester carboxylesterase
MTAGSLFYLHGFASGARSTKASYFSARFRSCGRTLHCPDFNQPDFTTLTITRMLGQLDSEMAARDSPATLIGSSLGGSLAILAAASWGARIDRLVLLAPAVMFAREGHHLVPPDRLAEWRRLGRIPFFHYSENAERMLNFSFYEDSLRYNPFDAVFWQPTLIFQGVRDRSVDPRSVQAFASARPNARLELLEDDHQLGANLPRIWDAVADFLEVR